MPASQIENNTSISDVEYLEQRISEQQKYHSNKASAEKKRFITCNLCVMILSALIPVITCFSDYMPFITKVLISAAGGASTVITGYISLSNMHHTFISSRVASEKLKMITYLYKTKTPPFENEDAFELLVTTCESILYNENEEWSQINKKSVQQTHPTGS